MLPASSRSAASWCSLFELTYCFWFDVGGRLRNWLSRTMRHHRRWLTDRNSLSWRRRDHDSGVSCRGRRGRQGFAPEDGHPGPVSLDRVLDRGRRAARVWGHHRLLRHLDDGRPLRKDRHDRGRILLRRRLSDDADVGGADVRNFYQATIVAALHGFPGFSPEINEIFFTTGRPAFKIWGSLFFCFFLTHLRKLKINGYVDKRVFDAFDTKQYKPPLFKNRQ